MKKNSKKPELSIIIPTLNEEETLPLLLESLRKNLKKIKAEVIIVDGYSEDKTVKVAKKSKVKNLKVFLCHRGPAHQRNYGAEKAKAPLLLFLDADVILPRNFLRRALEEIEERKLDVAAVCCKVKESGLWEKFCYDFMANLWMRLFERIKPFGHCCFFIKKELHKKICGFDETLSFGEDSEYLERAKKAGGKFRILKGGKFIASARAFKKYGRSQSIALAYLNVYRLFGGERRKEKKLESLYGKFTKFSPTYIENKIKEEIKKVVEFEKELANRYFYLKDFNIKQF